MEVLHGLSGAPEFLGLAFLLLWGKKREGTGEEWIELGKALMQPWNGCAFQSLLCVEAVADGPETSELSSISKQIIDQECGERAKIRENLLNWSRLLCVYLKGPKCFHLKSLIFGAFTVSVPISLVRQLNSFLRS